MVKRHSMTIEAKNQEDAMRKAKRSLLHPRDWILTKVKLESSRKIYKVTFRKKGT